jgi:hypothetical protein
MIHTAKTAIVTPMVAPTNISQWANGSLRSAWYG